MVSRVTPYVEMVFNYFGINIHNKSGKLEVLPCEELVFAMVSCYGGTILMKSIPVMGVLLKR